MKQNQAKKKLTSAACQGQVEGCGERALGRGPFPVLTLVTNRMTLRHHLTSLYFHSLTCPCRLKIFSNRCKVECMMVLTSCSSIQHKQPYYTWLQNPKGAHTMLILISELFPLHGTFHPSSSPENHLLSLRTHLERYPSTHTPWAVSAKTECCHAIGQPFPPSRSQAP